MLLLLHALFNLVYIKFFLYLRPAREEGPSFLAAVAVIKVVVYMCLYFGLCISRGAVTTVSAVNIFASISIFCMLLHI